MLKKTLIFYLYIFFPLLTIMLISKLNLLSANLFMYCILAYALIYHPVISGIRLIQLNICNKNSFWLNFIPLWNLKYFDILFWGAKKVS